MAPLGISSRSVLGIAQRNPSTRAEGSRNEASGASRTPLQARQQAAVGLRRVGGAGDDDENGQHADGRGQARAQQPAEAAALARIGMVADVDVAERAMACGRDRRAVRVRGWLWPTWTRRRPSGAWRLVCIPRALPPLPPSTGLVPSRQDHYLPVPHRPMSNWLPSSRQTPNRPGMQTVAKQIRRRSPGSVCEAMGAVLRQAKSRGSRCARCKNSSPTR